MVLVGSLALGVILASDVFHSAANVETLLFGSLLLIGTRELVLAAVFSALVVGATALLGRRWLATGFDPGATRAIGARSQLPDVLLLVLIAVGVVASIDALGALLVTALLVVPAATARLWTDRLRSWQVASTALVLVEGTAGLWISVKANAPPGAAIATLAGAVFAVAAMVRALGLKLVLGAAALTGAVAVLAGCGGGGPGSQSHGVSVVATTTQIADWARAVGGQRGDRAPDPPAEYRPARVRAAPGRRDRDERRRPRTGERRRPRLVDGQGRLPGGGPPRRGRPRRPRSRQAPRGASGPEASPFDPHWWHDPRNAEAAVAQIRDSLVLAEPAHEALFRRNGAAYLAKLERLDRGIAPASPGCASRASSSPTTTPSATSPPATGSRSWNRDPLADDAGAAVGGRARRS